MWVENYFHDEESYRSDWVILKMWIVRSDWVIFKMWIVVRD